MPIMGFFEKNETLYIRNIHLYILHYFWEIINLLSQQSLGVLLADVPAQDPAPLGGRGLERVPLVQLGRRGLARHAGPELPLQLRDVLHRDVAVVAGKQLHIASETTFTEIIKIL